MRTFLKIIISFFIIFEIKELISTPVKAEVNPSNRDRIPRQRIIPPPFPRNFPEEKKPSAPPQPPLLTPQPEKPLNIPTAENIFVTEFKFTGNTVFSTKELSKKFTDNLVDRSLSLSQLLAIANDIAKLYADSGYITSGAILSIPRSTREQGKGIVEIQIIEAKVTEIKIARSPDSSRRIKDYYLRSRLNLKTSKPLNIDRLQEGLQLLQLDPLIEQISATLKTGTNVGENILEVTITEAPTFNIQTVFENSRSPSVGSFQRGIEINQGNLFGFGDSLRGIYNNTDGSNSLGVIYNVPINARNGSIDLIYQRTLNNVTEPIFNTLDLESFSQLVEINFGQPIFQTIEGETFRDFNLGLTNSLQDSEFSLFNIPFPLSPGADDNGNLRIFALRFYQEYSQRNASEVIAVRSRFSLGLNTFDSTINEQIIGVEKIPDSRFFSWQGQGQYVRIIAPKTLLLLRANTQISDRFLVSSEQFSLGGFDSVRGYRQNQILSDNGLFISAEVRIPILEISNKNGILQIIPFIDYGTTWNNETKQNIDTQSLAAIGVGLQLQLSDRLTARIDYGIPLISIDFSKRSLQENGIYFSVRWTPINF